MPASRGTRGQRAGGHLMDDSYEYAEYEYDEPGRDDAADDALEEDERPGRRASGTRPPRVPAAATAGRIGLRHVADLTGKDVEGVTLVKPSGDGWTVEVEVVEDHRVPSSGDTLAIYALDLDTEGDLVSYRRVRTYKRTRGDPGGVY